MEVQLHSFLTLGLKGGVWSATRPGPPDVRGKSRQHPLNCKVGGPQEQPEYFGDEINLLRITPKKQARIENTTISNITCDVTSYAALQFTRRSITTLFNFAHTHTHTHTH